MESNAITGSGGYSGGLRHDAIIAIIRPAMRNGYFIISEIIKSFLCGV